MMLQHKQDIDIASSFLRRKGLREAEWLGLAWMAVQDAHRRFDPMRGSFLTCARVAIAGAVKNERGRIGTVAKWEDEDTDSVETRAAPCTQEDTAMIRQFFDSLSEKDRRLCESILQGMTLREAGKKEGYNEDWGCRRLRAIVASWKRQSKTGHVGRPRKRLPLGRSNRVREA
jgi:hypothetical protein